MSERLTDEQVAEAQLLLRTAFEAMPGWRTEEWRLHSPVSKVYLYAEQVSADLSAAKASNQGLCVQLDETQNERDLCEAQRDSAAKSLAALQEAAREAASVLARDIGTQPTPCRRWLAGCKSPALADRCLTCHQAAALSSLRALLPEAGR